MNVGKEFVGGIIDVGQIREHHINLHAYYICINFKWTNNKYLKTF